MPKDFLGLPRCGFCGENDEQEVIVEADGHNTRQPFWRQHCKKKKF